MWYSGRREGREGDQGPGARGPPPTGPAPPHGSIPSCPVGAGRPAEGAAAARGTAAATTAAAAAAATATAATAPTAAPAPVGRQPAACGAARRPAPGPGAAPGAAHATAAEGAPCDHDGGQRCSAGEKAHRAVSSSAPLSSVLWLPARGPSSQRKWEASPVSSSLPLKEAHASPRLSGAGSAPPSGLGSLGSDVGDEAVLVGGGEREVWN